ncbi:MAG: hypothetical protein U0736_15870 [Gemmataceae bacterium]
MIDLVLSIALAMLLGGVAFADDRSPILWGAITFVLCLLSLLIPLPVVRLVIVMGMVLVALFVCNLIRPPIR